MRARFALATLVLSMSAAACGARTSLTTSDSPDAAAPAPVAIGCPDAPGLQPGAPWPAPRRCPGRTGSTPVPGPTSMPRVQWSVPLAAPPVTHGIAGFASQSSVIAADGNLYVGTTDGLLAFDAGGRLRWRALRGTDVYSLMVGTDGTLYAASGTTDGYGNATAVVTAFSPTGEVEWTFVPACQAAAVTVSPGLNGDLVVTVIATQCYPLAYFTSLHADGTVAWSWSVDREEHLLAGPSVGPDGTLYFTTAGINVDYLVALSPGGALRWHDEMPSGNGSPAQDLLVAPDGTLYVEGLSGFETAAFSPQGPSLWFKKDFSAVAIAADGTLYGKSPTGVSASHPDGNVFWTWSPPAGTSHGEAIVAPDAIYVPVICVNFVQGCTPGITALDLQGSPLWTLGGVRPVWLMMGAHSLYAIALHTEDWTGPYDLVAIGP